MKRLRPLHALVLCLTGLLLAPSVIGLEAGAVQDAGGWQWPTGGPVQVSRSFDPPSAPWLPGHRGVDLRAGPGNSIRAPAKGVVVYAGVLVDREVISLRHAGGLRSTYEPVRAEVAVGDLVHQGQVIGTLLPGHAADALHWGAKYSDDVYVDPLSLVFGQAILKPW